MTTQIECYENLDIADIEKRLEILFCAISKSDNKTCRKNARHILSSTKEKGLHEKHKKNNRQNAIR